MTIIREYFHWESACDTFSTDFGRNLVNIIFLLLFPSTPDSI